MTAEKAIVLIECSANELRETLKETTMPSSAAEQLQRYIDAYEMAISALRQQEHKCPCNLCGYGPPSSMNGKPCTMCPAVPKQEPLSNSKVVKSSDLFDEDGGEIQVCEPVTNRNGLKVVEIDQVKPPTLDEVTWKNCATCSPDSQEDCRKCWCEWTQSQNDPLTLYELRKMDGEPVFLVDLVHKSDPKVPDLCGGWIVFTKHDQNGFIPRGGGFFSNDGYGKNWLSYRQKPKEETK